MPQPSWCSLFKTGHEQRAHSDMAPAAGTSAGSGNPVCGLAGLRPVAGTRANRGGDSRRPGHASDGPGGANRAARARFEWAEVSGSATVPARGVRSQSARGRRSGHCKAYGGRPGRAHGRHVSGLGPTRGQGLWRRLEPGCLGQAAFDRRRHPDPLHGGCRCAESGQHDSLCCPPGFRPAGDSRSTQGATPVRLVGPPQRATL